MKQTQKKRKKKKKNMSHEEKRESIVKSSGKNWIKQSQVIFCTEGIIRFFFEPVNVYYSESPMVYNICQTYLAIAPFLGVKHLLILFETLSGEHCRRQCVGEAQLSARP